MTPHYASPEAWAAGADAAYEALSVAVVAASPASLAGLVVVDLGAGTGATSRAIAAAGGWPLALDESTAMLAFRSPTRPPAVAADIGRLPLRDRAVGAAIAAFSLSHLDEPALALIEAARVTAIGGVVLAGVFAATGARHPAKSVVEEEAARLGWSPPDWYLHFKGELEPQVAAEGALEVLAGRAGLVDVRVTDVIVDAGLVTAAALVAWRLSVPSLAPFVAALAPDRLAALIEATEAALGEPVQPLRPVVRILSSVVPAAR